MATIPLFTEMAERCDFMFREMRRKKQKLSQEEAYAILERGTSGVLGLLGDEGYPYTIPLSYGPVSYTHLFLLVDFPVSAYNRSGGFYGREIAKNFGFCWCGFSP